MTVSPLSGARKGGRLAATTLGALLIASAPLPASGSAFKVNPVVVEIRSGGRNAAITVRNSETVPVSIRVRLFRWTQPAGADDYADTEEVIASPPIFTLPGGGTQLLRVGPRGKPLSGAYRIVLEEIAPAVAAQAGQVRIVLRLNLPLYVTPERAAVPVLAWTGWRDGSGNLMLEARNTGNRYDSVTQIAVADAQGKDVILTTSMGAVLPGGSRRWQLGKHPEIAPGAAMRLTVRSSIGNVTHSQIQLARS